MRVVFMGTPDFAVATLDKLVQNNINIVAVVTTADKLGGRGGNQLIESAVKQYAVANSLPILQPLKLKDPVFVSKLEKLKADLFIVVAFRMLPQIVWEMPKIGTFNLHGSLLPKYRGAAPINWAIINGEKETGVSTFFLKHEIDTGDLLFQEKVEIGEDENFGDLYHKMKEIGADLVIKTIQSIQKKEYKPLAQDESQVIHAPKIFSEDCKIEFDQTTQKVHDFIRGLSPIPTAWTIVNGQKLKILKAEKSIEPHHFDVGEFITDNRSYLKISTNDGYIKVLELQLEGKKKMDTKSFLNGYKF
jgi:methionyl-tRNA formyltransferase